MNSAGLPSRIDQELMAATDNDIEFTIIGDNGPLNITSDTIELRVLDAAGGDPVLGKTNSTGQHSDPANGKTVFTLTAVELLTGSPENTRWWYEIRRTAAITLKKKCHIVGELNIAPSVVRR